MNSFSGTGKKRDEYDLIYNNSNIIHDYEELDENEDVEETIERIRNTIGRGDCIYCGAKHAMEYEGHICFICSKCGKSVHEDIYYRWAAGCTIEFDE